MADADSVVFEADFPESSVNHWTEKQDEGKLVVYVPGVHCDAVSSFLRRARQNGEVLQVVMTRRPRGVEDAVAGRRRRAAHDD